nr:hypothetical protein [uncultured Methanoregula sp.]
MFLVVDANFAYSAINTKSTSKEALKCGEILLTIYDANHDIVISQCIHEEWMKHAREGSPCLRWFTQMIRESRVVSLPDVRDTELRQELKEEVHKLYKPPESNSNCAIIKKDLDYIESANLTHKTILSRERKSREHIRNVITKTPHFRNYSKLKNILWLRPQESTIPENDIALWLKKDANTWIKKGGRASDLSDACSHWKLIKN